MNKGNTKKTSELRHHLQNSPEIYCIACSGKACRHSNFDGQFAFSLTYLMFSILSVAVQLIILKTLQFQTTNIYYLRVFQGQEYGSCLAAWFWSGSHKVTVKLLVRTVAFQASTKAEGFMYVIVGDFSSSRVFCQQLPSFPCRLGLSMEQLLML